jgi:hypothetical protein
MYKNANFRVRRIFPVLGVSLGFLRVQNLRPAQLLFIVWVSHAALFFRVSWILHFVRWMPL